MERKEAEWVVEKRSGERLNPVPLLDFPESYPPQKSTAYHAAERKPLEENGPQRTSRTGESTAVMLPMPLVAFHSVENDRKRESSKPEAHIEHPQNEISVGHNHQRENRTASIQHTSAQINPITPQNAWEALKSGAATVTIDIRARSEQISAIRRSWASVKSIISHATRKAFAQEPSQPKPVTDSSGTTFVEGVCHGIPDTGQRQAVGYIGVPLSEVGRDGGQSHSIMASLAETGKNHMRCDALYESRVCHGTPSPISAEPVIGFSQPSPSPSPGSLRADLLSSEGGYGIAAEGRAGSREGSTTEASRLSGRLFAAKNSLVPYSRKEPLEENDSNSWKKPLPMQ